MLGFLNLNNHDIVVVPLSRGEEFWEIFYIFQVS